MIHIKSRACKVLVFRFNEYFFPSVGDSVHFHSRPVNLSSHSANNAHKHIETHQ